MTGWIITARHGRPHVDRSVKITSREYDGWWKNYDLAGLAPDQQPPGSLCEIAQNCDVVFSSTLPRAIETASALVAGTRDVPTDQMFVEAPLPPPPVPFLKLTPTTWGVISRSFWFWGYAPGSTESVGQARDRVEGVADRLIGLASGGNSVLLCAHGYLNWMIDRRLANRGWKKTVHEGGNNYWSYRVYQPRNAAASSVGKTIPAETL